MSSGKQTGKDTLMGDHARVTSPTRLAHTKVCQGSSKGIIKKGSCNEEL